ncbi:MAG: SDR family oxidoreductase [Chrysiogenetes bacterium]|nr:SDR family oxidoreductase [Chrysiogenetes bacterium]
MKDKIVVITGANSGIGKAAATDLARKGAHVVMLCRNQSKAEAAREEIRRDSGSDTVDFIQADLASFDSIRQAAAQVQKDYPRIDVLLNNAGLMLSKRSETADGFEMQFGTNHLGPFLLTNLLLQTLKDSGPARIVNVASAAHWGGKIKFDDLNMSKGRYIGFLQYCHTKLMNILFTRELARRIEGTRLTTNCLHPGGVNTNFAAGQAPGFLDGIVRSAMITPEQGARTSVYLASDPAAANVSGEYFAKCKKAMSSRRSKNMADALRLWTVSEQLVGLK